MKTSEIKQGNAAPAFFLESDFLAENGNLSDFGVFLGNASLRAANLTYGFLTQRRYRFKANRLIFVADDPLHVEISLVSFYRPLLSSLSRQKTRLDTYKSDPAGSFNCSSRLFYAEFSSWDHRFFSLSTGFFKCQSGHSHRCFQKGAFR